MQLKVEGKLQACILVWFYTLCHKGKMNHKKDLAFTWLLLAHRRVMWFGRDWKDVLKAHWSSRWRKYSAGPRSHALLPGWNSRPSEFWKGFWALTQLWCVYIVHKFVFFFLVLEKGEFKSPWCMRPLCSPQGGYEMFEKVTPWLSVFFSPLLDWHLGSRIMRRPDELCWRLEGTSIIGSTLRPGCLPYGSV